MSASRKKRLGASRIQGRGDAIEDSVDQLRGQQQVIRAVGKELREKEEEVRKKEAEVRKKEAELRKMEEELRKLEVEAEEEKEQEEDSGDLFGSSLDFVFGPPNTARKERMYMHTPVRVGIWDVVKEIEDYVSNADKRWTPTAAAVGYGILTNARHWYLVKRDHAGHFYISKCFNWGDTEPPLLAAIAYLVSSAVESRNEFDKKGESSWSRRTRPTLYTRFPIRSKRSCSNLREDQLDEIPASKLHLDDRPITTPGGHCVVGGTLDNRRVAVKLGPRNSQRSEDLMNEVGAYLKLHEHWGDFLPVLVGYGTTANGQVFFIATELIDGSPLGAGNATKKVHNAAARALCAVHACHVLYKNVAPRNILVVQGTQPSVRLIDFSLAMCTSDKTLQMEELKHLQSWLNCYRDVS